MCLTILCVMSARTTLTHHMNLAALKQFDHLTICVLRSVKHFCYLFLFSVFNDLFCHLPNGLFLMMIHIYQTFNVFAGSLCFAVFQTFCVLCRPSGLFLITICVLSVI